MASGLQRTLDLLATTRNEAAVDALVMHLESDHSKIRNGVFETLLRRRSPAGHREVLRRLHDLPSDWRPIVQRYCGRMSMALRDAVVGSDPDLFQNACHAILWFHEYDLMPALVIASEGSGNPNAGSAAATVLRLAEQLYEQVSGNRNYHDRRDLQRIRNELIVCLEGSLARYPCHKRLELVEAYLVLVGRENQVLNDILHAPHDPRHACVMESLASSPLAGIMRLLLSFLDNPRAPGPVIRTLSQRRDIRFLVDLFHHIQQGLSSVAQRHLKRIDHVSWFGADRIDLEKLDETAQQGLVRLVTVIGIPRSAKFDLLAHVLAHGSPMARRDACEALADYSGQQAGHLILAALDDPAPEVQAQAALQVRQRGLPGTMNRLIALLKSPHDMVRRAVRSALDEFTFDRFLSSFELLDERIRQSTAELVRQVDPDSASRIMKELEAPTITARIRAIEMAVTLALVPEVTDALCALLENDEDHFVRSAAASALAEYDSPRTRAALQSAMADHSRSVREAAHSGLLQLGPQPEP
ncbi:MAG: HEAT repeat domain-containing protein [Pirellulales bacterium]|nr:HEAT repeat domain-containing protein [Pirellulales bacterium]